MSEKIIEKLDAIEAAQSAKIEEVKVAAVAATVAAIEEAKISFEEKVAALEAKVSSVSAVPTIKTYKTISAEINRSVKEQIRDFYKSGARVEKELKMFADESHYNAYMTEASALTGGGAGIGGRTAYDPVFVPLRLMNPMRGVARAVAAGKYLKMHLEQNKIDSAIRVAIMQGG